MRISGYNSSIETQMRDLFNSLSEKDRRRYAAVEALKLGYGGITYICKLFLCDEKTVQRGLRELQDSESLNQESIRLPGGGRPSKMDCYSGIDEQFLRILQDHTAGSPTDSSLKWTNLSRKEIQEKLALVGISVSRQIVKKLLHKHGFVRRKLQKKKSTGHSKDRDRQFRKIKKLRKKYKKRNNPVISIDGKKKEKIGNLYREGTLECREAIEVYDHDFPSLAEHDVHLYAVYDMKHNDAVFNINTSFETSEFACDSIKLWWDTVGKSRYPNADSILILADGGGSNSSRRHIFKAELQRISNLMGIEIRIAHYPPYTSKWNPIEHRLFPHVTRSLSGMVLTSVELVRDLIKKTSTEGGLKVLARISKKFYEKGKEVAADFYETACLKFDKCLGHLNYVVSPNM